MAVVRREVSDRTAFGKIVKWLFIIFNVVMLIIMAVSCSASGQAINAAAGNSEYPDAATAGATIGAGLALGSVIFLWLAGDIILGMFVLFTKRKKIIEVEE